MNNSRLWIIGWLVLGAAAVAERPLQIYLPQEIRLDDQTVELGRVGILLGDAELVEKAQSVTLGSFAVDGQTLLVDRNTILSRLASDGIRPAQVRIRGADTVRITRYEMTIPAEQITACAKRYLDNRLSDQKAAEAILVRPPQPQILSTDRGAAELTVIEDSRLGGSLRRIRVAILQDGETVGSEEVYFKVQYQVRRVIAAEELPPATVLTSENIRIETISSDQPEQADWTAPYGMATTRRIAEGSVISDALLESPQGPVVVRRRQLVMVRIDNGALFVSAHGEAMDEGRVGETIRVRRGQRPHERTIICRVQADGTVEPVL
ncbi:MAG TPA: flagellar basal body P-ring formation protein FlgA [Phycisphaerales bacterium]|nr:flagellar basal body P-ring formation protein FlgA [Phycisphaerales bacterium]